MSTPEYHVPETLLYSKHHVWVKAEGSLFKLGATDYIKKTIKIPQHIYLARVGSRVNRSEVFASIETNKIACDVASPLTGEVVEVNRRLFNYPAQYYFDPYGEGWLVKLKATNEEVRKASLLDSKAYVAYLVELSKDKYSILRFIRRPIRSLLRPDQLEELEKERKEGLLKV